MQGFNCPIIIIYEDKFTCKSLHALYHSNLARPNWKKWLIAYKVCEIILFFISFTFCAVILDFYLDELQNSLVL